MRLFVLAAQDTCTMDVHVLAVLVSLDYHYSDEKHLKKDIKVNSE